MSVYYNEHDPMAAAWLRELMAAKEIPDGYVDTRSIVDVRPADLAGFVQCHFFAGIGGWPYALRLAGWPDDRPVWTGSCPCQPFSSAGAQAGGDDPRHLWPAWFRLIRECGPSAVFGEQVEAAIGHGWFDLVCDDLEREGYAVGAACLPAACVGAPHLRQRLFFVAESQRAECGTRRPGCGGEDSGRAYGEPPRSGAVGGVADAESRGQRIDRRALGHADITRPQGRIERGDRSGECATRPASVANAWADPEWIACRDGKARPTQRGIQPCVDGLPRGVVPSGDPSAPDYANGTPEARVMRLRGYGNAIVPQVAALWITAYTECDR